MTKSILRIHIFLWNVDIPQEHCTIGLFLHRHFDVSLPAACPWSCSFGSSHRPKQAAFKISIVSSSPNITNLALYLRNTGCLFKQAKAAASLISYYIAAHSNIKMFFPLFLLYQLVTWEASNEIRSWGPLEATVFLERALGFTNSSIQLFNF